MRFATAIASLLTIGLAAAASRRSTCAAQNILDACLASTTPQLKACEPNDWKCMCEQSNNVLTCYNNCPGDDGQFGAQQTKTSYCNAANAYDNTSTSTSSSSSKGMSATAATAASASASSAESAASSASEASETASSSASSASGKTSTHSSTGTSSGSLAHSTSSSSGAVGLTVQGGLVAALALGLGVML